MSSGRCTRRKRAAADDTLDAAVAVQNVDAVQYVEG